MNSQHYAPIFDGIIYGVLFLIGVFYTYVGSGYNLAKLFGKAFIDIDKEMITIKSGALRKQQKILWKDITSINLSNYNIININEESLILDLSKLEYSLEKDIKQVICSIAKEKGLTVIPK